MDILSSNATETQFASSSSSIFTLHLDKKDFSLSSSPDVKKILPPVTIPPTIGHTSHLHVPSNSIISVFGMQQQNKEAPPLIPSTPSVAKQKTNTPTGRYKHTSVLMNTELYVIGGEHVPTKTENKEQPKFIESQDSIWSYSFTTKSWSKIGTTVTPSMAGHTSIVYKQWLISCFGRHLEGGLSESCTWFDTITFNSTTITPTSSSIAEWPTARIHASMISLENNKHVLFGGEQSRGNILDDLWKLNVESAFKMTWQRVQYNTNQPDTDYYKRSGHASTLLGDENVILYYGGQNGPLSLATDPIFLDVSKMEWIRTSNTNGDRIIIHKNSVEQETVQEKHKLGGGAIVGIIISAVGIVAICIGLFIWRKRHHRQRSIHQKSRAARFSQSPTPMYSMQQQEEKQKASVLFQGENRIAGTGLLADRNFLSLPELALSRESSNSRISAISLGAEFRFSADDYRHSHQSAGSTNIGGTIPKIELASNKETRNQPLSILSEESNDFKKRESIGFKRLTLNLFSGSQQDEVIRKKDRSSSLFQLRASKLLQPTTPSTPDGKYPHSPKTSALQSRVSLGAKSVSSVQWVGFNDNMDYKGNNWRDSSTSSMHLAVTNAQRASSYYSDSTQSTPRSPMFPSNLRDSAVHYQLNELEANSWNSEQGRSTTTPPEK
ncbi:hypothetical protein INT47_011246 [Mucor saturninus]|uniref:Uncharacterized protein n=1 Tax=Mucor saturninus TaxID=64648 RepID=A0A8H7VBX0_9FUNG|nr:hypothetical protein INT47_011246 [Mucor saturninus]